MRFDAAAAPSGRRRSWTVAIALAAAGAVIVLLTSLGTLAVRAARPHPMTPYVAPQYWLSYADGFVRRGLPGAALRAVAGGQPPGYPLVKVVAVALTAAALIAVLVLALLLSRQAGDRLGGIAVLAAMVASPLGISHLARDVGRTDALGVVVLVALVAVPWGRLPPVAVVGGVAVLTSMAVASEEFLVAFVLPPALLTLRSALAGRRFRRACLGAALLPALLLTVMSAVTTAPPAALARAHADARSAGVPSAVPLVGGPPDHDAVSRLGYGLVQNIADYYATTTPLRVLVTMVVWALVYLALLGLVWRLLGRPLRHRTLLLVATGMAMVALALSVIAIDYRRWWALAALTALCLVLQLGREVHRRPEPPTRGVVAILLLLTVAGLVLRAMPVYPLDASHVERLLRLPW